MYTINFHGEGMRYWLCKLPEVVFDLFRRFREAKELSWEEVFFDMHLLDKLGYKYLDDFHVIHKGGGWVLNRSSSVMEVRKSGRRKMKIRAEELYSNDKLFNVYDLVYDQTPWSQEEGFHYVFLCQLETGGIAKYPILEFDFSMEKLRFHLNFAPLRKLVMMDWLEGISYGGERLISTWEDTVVMRQKVYVVDEIVNAEILKRDG